MRGRSKASIARSPERSSVRAETRTGRVVRSESANQSRGGPGEFFAGDRCAGALRGRQPHRVAGCTLRIRSDQVGRAVGTPRHDRVGGLACDGTGLPADRRHPGGLLILTLAAGVALVQVRTRRRRPLGRDRWCDHRCGDRRGTWLLGPEATFQHARPLTRARNAAAACNLIEDSERVETGKAAKARVARSTMLTAADAPSEP